VSAVVIVGAGIVGSSIAYHLARRGASVTLIDRAPALAAGATGASFAWIGDSGGEWPGGAEDLRGSVLADHRRLEAELPGARVRWTGSLTWRGFAGTDPGRGRRWVGRGEIAALEPSLRTPPDRAAYAPGDGGVDPVRFTEVLIRSARALGARVVLGSTVTSLRHDGALTTAEFHPASTIVLAAGAGVAALCEPLGARLPVEASPAFSMRVAAPPGLVRTIVAAPHFEAREFRDGELLVTASHAGEDLQLLARRTVDRLRSAFAGDGDLRVLGHGLGRRPMPRNGPIVGYVTRSVYVAVMHSAMTLAPTIGRLVAQELLTGKPPAELAHCRPPGL
jgi:glycine/D-amino acid oxidase-like deaminating enzyme